MVLRCSKPRRVYVKLLDAILHNFNRLVTLMAG